MSARARGATDFQALLAELRTLVGPRGWTDDPVALEPHLTEWRGRVHGRTPLMLRPETVEQVRAIVAACSAQGVGIVPQGGNTGMCAGAVPDTSGRQVLVNLGRLRRVRSVSADDGSMVADAGCILADVQRAAADAGLFFPLSLAAEGTCQIGGNVATNAGGINVLRYGTARDLVLGIEAVLPDGTLFEGLQSLRKNTAGYDLKQLFIGSEGTLGIITAVCLKLFPDPGPVHTALLGFMRPGDAVRALARLRRRLPDRLQAFELIGQRAMDFVLRHIDGARKPFAASYPWYVLLDAAVPADELEAALDDLLLHVAMPDAILAKNRTEQTSLWRLRHSIAEAERREGVGVKHDIAVPIGCIEAFINEADARLAVRVPAAMPVVFGHVGDGNLHYNALLHPDVQDADLGRLSDETSRVVYDLVTEMGGSISAEHGIGVLKKDALLRYGDPVALALMRSVKRALDPGGIMNPGKVI
ncbi:MAG TPA: FAD-binding oxidoreductase [Woeseiaceae bacterium]|nr:FAD-binding oxidoreductase [Woeseiaceae bacterium]